MSNEMDSLKIKDFIEKVSNKKLDKDEEIYFYEFIGEKLVVVSDICKQISKEEISQAHIYSVKSMLDILVSCIDMKIDELS